jgi:hypothetical protein
MSAQSVLELEQREKAGSITLARLAAAAAALNCELRTVLVPRTSLEATVRAQAEGKARAERDALLHTMRLEGQEGGVAEALDLATPSAARFSTRNARLWD